MDSSVTVTRRDRIYRTGPLDSDKEVGTGSRRDRSCSPIRLRQICRLWALTAELSLEKRVRSSSRRLHHLRSTLRHDNLLSIAEHTSVYAQTRMTSSPPVRSHSHAEQPEHYAKQEYPNFAQREKATGRRFSSLLSSLSYFPGVDLKSRHNSVNGAWTNITQSKHSSLAKPKSMKENSRVTSKYTCASE